MTKRITADRVLKNAEIILKEESYGLSQILQDANQFIKMNKAKINNQLKPAYHFTGEIGWINDPNGFSCYKGEYHLFYQYHPYDNKWGPMHWGHAVTRDFIKWEHREIVLAPDQFYDHEGCFSGTGLQAENMHVLMYTGNSYEKPDSVGLSRQVQCLAVGNGYTYIKLESNPVIGTHQIPHGCSLADFRDPKIWKKGNIYYAAVGSRHNDGSGQIILYQSDNLLEWKYVGTMLKSDNKIGRMWECPDVFELNEKDILLISPQEMKKEEHRFHNEYGTIYMIGKLDYFRGEYICSSYDEIDYGLDFYAPQTLETPDGRRIMIAWMQLWERNIPSSHLGWAGAMTLPRELKLKADRLIQVPVKEIEKYRQNEVRYRNVKVQGISKFLGIKGRQIELQIDIDVKESKRFEIKLMKGKDAYTEVIYDTSLQILTFDRSNSKSGIDGLNRRTMPVNLYDNKVKLRIFIDRYSIEIFANEGEGTMSSTVYSNIEDDDIEMMSDQLILVDIVKWDLIIK
ncbi:MAG: hypothetical protein K0S71_2756 [Clostridia bacterium]|jgi:beta-fructofuranosidase|nr:hypothetical protein [Clostridia bacterium]